MVQEMRLAKVYEHFMRPIVALAAALALAIASSACTGGPAMDDGVISGVVEGENGPERSVPLSFTDDHARLAPDHIRCVIGRVRLIAPRRADKQ